MTAVKFNMVKMMGIYFGMDMTLLGVVFVGFLGLIPV